MPGLTKTDPASPGPGEAVGPGSALGMPGCGLRAPLEPAPWPLASETGP